MTVLSLEAAKQQCRIDGTDDDDLITALIDAAIDHAERFTGLVLTARTVTETLAGFGGRLNTWPIGSITSVSYRDTTNADQALATGAWFTSLASRPVRLNPAAGYWPALGGGDAPVTVTMEAGYADGQVPASIVQAVKLLVGTFYQQREAVSTQQVFEVPLAVDALLRSHRLALV